MSYNQGNTQTMIVVGAGMVGAAAALAFAQQGHKVTVLEREKSVAWSADDDYGLRLSAISPASAALLADLGIWAQVLEQRHCGYRDMRVWDGEGEGQIHFNAGEQGLPELGTIVENQRLQSLLWAALEAHSNIDLLLGDNWQQLQNNDLGVELTLASGRRLKADLLLAADGGQSKVREALGIKCQSRGYGQRGVVANVACSASHQYTAWQRFFANDVLAFLPLADGRCSIVWSTDDANAQRLAALPEQEFLVELNMASSQCVGQVTASSARASFPLQAGIAAQFIQQRVVLIGDAAHTIHPLAGQGVNLGFGDVAALSKHLKTGITIAGLRRYQRQRKAENAQMILGVDGLQRLFASDAAAVQWLRSSGLNLVNNLNPIKKLLAAQSLGA